jgi:sugar (pentulose or hexulose) kinase
MIALKKDVIVIFDIGEVVKRYLIYDSNLDLLYQDNIQFSPIEDNDGDTADDLSAIVSWIKIIVQQIISYQQYHLVGINFSTYGASLVHLDYEYQRVAPFYSYNKYFPLSLFNDFEQKHNSDRLLAIETGSPGVGMINSGFQLYWLKYHKPTLYCKIYYSLHLPQYLSFIFTGVPLNDYTSVGCHSALWNYQKKKLHTWTVAEKIHTKLAPLVSSDLSIRSVINKKRIDVGVGILNHSAVLVPYLKTFSKPFILVQSDTWSVALNPFYGKELSIHELAKGCFYYMQPNGKPVLAHRLFLGEEYRNQVAKLSAIYKVKEKKIAKIPYDYGLDKAIKKSGRRYFNFPHLDNGDSLPEQLRFDNLARAYHQLMAELVDYQVSSIAKVRQNTPITRIIIEGYFSRNQIYMAMMANRLKGVTILASLLGTGAALGAAIILKPKWWSRKHFKSQMILPYK